MMIIGCLDVYGGLDAILPRADYIRLRESLPDSPSLPLYRRLGLGYRIRGGYKASTNPNHRLVIVPHTRLTGLQRPSRSYLLVGFVLAASSIWAPYWAAPDMPTGNTRRVIPTTLVPHHVVVCSLGGQSGTRRKKSASTPLSHQCLGFCGLRWWGIDGDLIRFVHLPTLTALSPAPWWSMEDVSSGVV
jgi:hypothetical protein